MKTIIKFLSSLGLTVMLLFLSIVLIFFGTLDQVHLGIRGAQEKYFESFLGIWQYPQQWPFSEELGWIHFPVLGGWLLGPLLLVNLIAAHLSRFQPQWKKIGIVAVHAGIVLMLVSQLLSSIFQEESYMWLDEGGSANYTESFYNDELVIIEKTHSHTDGVLSIPTQLIERPTSIQHPKMPFRVEVLAFYPNAEFYRQADASPIGFPRVDRGMGKEMGLVPRQVPKTYKQGERNAATAVVKLVGPSGPIGTWLVSNIFDKNFPPQHFSYEGREFEIALRIKRNYLPYTIALIDFTHDRYPGTEIPKNFSSKVRIVNPAPREDRQTLIYMNHPLRYAGLTYYQASFDKQDTASMLQVVRNPSWLLPYISCSLVTLGLLFQFGYHLVRFARKERS